MPKYSHTVEDYMEAIYVLIRDKGYARTKDISLALRLTPASVTEMLHKLSAMKLIKHEPYSPILLTKKGESLAKSVKTRHDTLKKLFKIVHVSDRTAERDACNVEHQLSPETIDQLTKFVEFVEKAPIYPKWLEHFKCYCDTGDYTCDHEEKRETS
ncbi:metal-dependent transcriptional regulator [Candidatus Altiarchaeota archaeon]